MRKTLYVLTVSTLMTSCATILNQPYKYITIYTTEQSEIIYKQDTINTIDNKAHLKVERKKEPLSIVATTDNLTKSIDIAPKSSIMYWSNIYFNYGIGMLVDMNNPKRYSYHGKIYINSADAISRYYKYGEANNKGELYLHLSLPFINSFRMMPENESAKVNTGLWGATIGLDYYHSKNQFVHLGVSGVSGLSNFFTQLSNLEFESMFSGYISLSNNHKIRRFSVGYGLSYANNIWTHSELSWFWFVPLETEIKSHNTFGLILPTYFQLGEYFNMGVVYRPTFYRPNMADKFLYEHLISIDFAWKIRLKK